MTKYFTILLLFIVVSSCKNDAEDDTIEDFKLENRKELGSSSSGLLSDEIYTSITVEFAFSEGFRPNQETIDGFITFLSDRVQKPDGINTVETIITSPDEGPFSTAEIRDIEDESRTTYTSGDDIAVYILFSNGNSSNDSETSVTLGTAYQNTSIVIYRKTLEEISLSQNFDLGILEATTLHHEFGHLFGLVNIQDDDIHSNHEDLLHVRHCIVEDCLMFFETRNTTLPRLNQFMRRSHLEVIPSFDADLCLQDLQAKGGL